MPGQLKQVILNLLDNAVRHTPEGREVGLSVTADGTSAHSERSILYNTYSFQ